MKHVLIVYASKAGSTAEVAAFMAHEFEKTPDVEVTVREVEDVTTLAAYDLIVIGSAIRIGAWLPKARQFVLDNLAILNETPTAFFTVCATLREDTIENRQEVETYLKPIHEILLPDDEAMFAGKIDRDTLTLWERFVLRLVGVPEGDYREWGRIREWVQHLTTDVLKVNTPA